jgi:hypothetical protein
LQEKLSGGGTVERAELDHLQQRADSEVRERFPGAPIQRVEVLQYGDDPEVEPGQFLIRVVIEVPADEGEREHAFHDFHDAHRAAIRELRRDLDRLPNVQVLEFVAAGEPAGDKPKGPVIRLGHQRGGLAGGDVTPVMARLGQEDLETLDTLITAGIAASRAEAVRWTLARIRERPAYEQLRARAREIEELRSQF